ncbi:hypothetical protein HYC85_000340 [Camellia sinensis]|uniref:Uncharacterized protein n=1 Tax=Camellia sinensis TaxID=4442 RepID=A0A7J7I3K4_CAMSI|nr:hypothetical protein HYC85_000340 [Camellia sinensis]
MYVGVDLPGYFPIKGPFPGSSRNSSSASTSYSSIQVQSDICSNKSHGAESLPPRIIESKSDFYLRRLWGEPSEVLFGFFIFHASIIKTVGFEKEADIFGDIHGWLGSEEHINAAINKFSEDFQILLFHYDVQTSEWDEFEWSRRAIHVSGDTTMIIEPKVIAARAGVMAARAGVMAARAGNGGKQGLGHCLKGTWYAKRFLQPDIVVAYDYIFIWDEDLGVEHFNEWQCREANGFLLSRERMAVLDANLAPKEACQLCVGNTGNSCAVDAGDSFNVIAYCCSHLMSGPFALPMLKAFCAPNYGYALPIAKQSGLQAVIGVALLVGATRYITVGRHPRALCSPLWDFGAGRQEGFKIVVVEAEDMEGAAGVCMEYQFMRYRCKKRV